MSADGKGDVVGERKEESEREREKERETVTTLLAELLNFLTP